MEGEGWKVMRRNEERKRRDGVGLEEVRTISNWVYTLAFVADDSWCQGRI